MFLSDSKPNFFYIKVWGLVFLVAVGFEVCKSTLCHCTIEQSFFFFFLISLNVLFFLSCFTLPLLCFRKIGDAQKQFLFIRFIFAFRICDAATIHCLLEQELAHAVNACSHALNKANPQFPEVRSHWANSHATGP